MKKNVAIIYGGYSSEHQISVQSGEYVASVIDDNKFNVFKILVKKSAWICTDNNKEVNQKDFTVSCNSQKIKFDIAIILIHGTPGENGILQAYLELQNVPYVGSGVLASSLTFNKFYCNSFLKSQKIKMAKSVLVQEGEKPDLTEIEKVLGLPMFVKPNAGGSSFGISKVKKSEELEGAINHAFTESNEVIIEQFIEGREITCGIVGKGKETTALPLCEVVSKNEFFDYEAKYNSELNEEIVPAPISSKLTEKCQKLSEKIYKSLNCKGIARVDFILKDDEFYFLEVNTIPGMTAESLVPKMIKHANINITDLYSELMNF